MTVYRLQKPLPDLLPFGEERSNPKENLLIAAEGRPFSITLFEKTIGAEGGKIFDSCKKISDFPSILYPSPREIPPLQSDYLPISIPDGIKNLTGHIRFDFEEEDKQWPLLQEIEGVFAFLVAHRPPGYLQDPNPLVVPLLKEMHPLFCYAWKKLDKKPEIYTDEYLESDSTYWEDEPAIVLKKPLPFRTQVYELFRRTVHLLQWKFIEETKSLGRGEYSLCKAYAKWNEIYLVNKMLLNRDFDLQFTDFWKQANASPVSGGLSEAEGYRREWDDRFGFKYILAHKDEVQKRIAELKKEPFESKQ